MSPEKRDVKYKKVNSKVLNYIGVVFFTLLSGFIIFMIYKAKQENKKFKEEGIRAEVTVMLKYKDRLVKTTNYYISGLMWIKEKGKISESGVNFTKSQSIKVSVSGSAYDTLNSGDKIMVVYLKEDPSKVKLLADVE